MTNYEKITMNVDKTAKFLSKSFIACEICPNNNNICDCDCERAIKNWLKSESEED